MADILIIGGSDAGISAALRAREIDSTANVTMVVADAFPNYSICGLPFYLSGEVADWHQLAHRTLGEIQETGINVELNTRALHIDPKQHTVLVHKPDKSQKLLQYDRLIIGTGADPIRPSIPGLDNRGVFLLHSMDDSFAAADFIASHKPERALIIGAGYIGLEMADALRHQKIGVTVVEQLPSVLPTVDRELGDALGTYIESHGVEVKTGVRIQEIGREGDALRVTGDDGFDRRVDMVLVVVGVKPVTELAKAAGIATGLRGAIIVNRSMATNVNDIYAAGDCVVTYHRLLNADTYMPLGTTAHKQGRVAGESAAGGQARYGGSLGTQVVKVFDWAVARTGLRDHEARSAGYHPVTVEFSTWDHKAYYPGAHRLTFRITGDEITGQLLGAQLMGHWQGAVAKRVDIFAMALYHQMSVADILEADLSYTPPLGSPWDAVQMAAEHWQKHRQDT
ncbi:MAG: FAD-dependent oxidoreductase [Firmicutes bacterium]|nr:FAD-dependent oxidoreductase [Bacillota bacterium]